MIFDIFEGLKSKESYAEPERFFEQSNRERQTRKAGVGRSRIDEANEPTGESDAD